MTVARPTKHEVQRGRPRKMIMEKFPVKTGKQVICINETKPESNKLKRATCDSIYDNYEVKNAVMQRAKEVQANLPPQFPSVIKLMLPSHVTGGFWLGLPKQFCVDHLPKQDIMIILEDENGVMSQAKYLTEKVGLSGGWRGFSIAHKLVEGDVLVFQLVTPKKFKVYIVRVNGSEEVDGALGLLRLEGCMNASPVQSVNPCGAVEEIEYSETQPVLACNSGHSENDSEDIEGIRMSESVVEFKEVKCFDDFDILINGLVINPELSKHLQQKYYDLCCSRDSFLHEHLIDGLNLKLAAGMIAETINIADAIRASKLTTPQDCFATWLKTLDAFKKLGMNVDFLIERLDQLMNLTVKSWRYKELVDRRVTVEDKMKTLEAKLLEVKEEFNGLDFEIKKLGANGENLELMFQEVAKAPW